MASNYPSGRNATTTTSNTNTTPTLSTTTTSNNNTTPTLSTTNTTNTNTTTINTNNTNEPTSLPTEVPACVEAVLTFNYPKDLVMSTYHALASGNSGNDSADRTQPSQLPNTSHPVTARRLMMALDAALGSGIPVPGAGKSRSRSPSQSSRGSDEARDADGGRRRSRGRRERRGRGDADVEEDDGGVDVSELPLSSSSLSSTPSAQCPERQVSPSLAAAANVSTLATLESKMAAAPSPTTPAHPPTNTHPPTPTPTPTQPPNPEVCDPNTVITATSAANQAAETRTASSSASGNASPAVTESPQPSLPHRPPMVEASLPQQESRTPTAAAATETSYPENSALGGGAEEGRTDPADAEQSGALEQSRRRRMLLCRLRALREENARLKARQLCRGCRQRPVELTFLPCGHFFMCQSCGQATNTCPACRKTVLADVKTFLS